MMRFNRTITLKPVSGMRQEQFEVQARWSRRDEASTVRRDRPAPPPAAVVPARVAAPVDPPAAEVDDGDEEGDELETGTPVAEGAKSADGTTPAGGGRRRRRRRRGRGGGGGAQAGSTATPAPKPTE